MIMQRMAEAEVNLKFVYLATDTRVVIGCDDISQARSVLARREASPDNKFDNNAAGLAYGISGGP